ncbi:hypothetical protein D3C75_785110 [compost metagenome]
MKLAAVDFYAKAGRGLSIQGGYRNDGFPCFFRLKGCLGQIRCINTSHRFIARFPLERLNRVAGTVLYCRLQRPALPDLQFTVSGIHDNPGCRSAV